MEDTPSAPQAFSQRRLPWLLGAAALVLYLITLNPWLRVGSIPTVAELSHWDGLQPFSRPLLWLISRPLKLLPEAQFPIALNALAALCAAASVGIIARCVSLLPYDRTRAQRVRGHSEDPLLHIPLAWLPPAFSALLLGLQLTFWEQATAQTGEMLDLLLFSACVLCLLEYRTSLRESWLWRLAFIYGIGVPGNWAMIAFFPLFLIALAWIRGLSILNSNLLLRLLGWGTLGLTVYLLMPAASLLSPDRGYSAFDVIKVVLDQQRDSLRGIPRGRFLLLGVVNLLPLVLVGIRWSGTKASSSLERMISEGAVILLQLGWLGMAVFMAFDLKFSQRQLIHLDPMYNGIPLLTYHFAAALAGGYFLGYFLLVGSVEPGRTWDRPSPGLQAISRLGWLIMIALGIGTPVALAARNWPRIQAQNGPHLESLARSIVTALPKEPSMVLSDDPTLHSLLTAHLIRNPELPPHLLINTAMARQPWYRQRLQRLHGTRWPGLAAVAEAQQDVASQFLSLLRSVAGTQHAFIVNPTLSFITEAYELRPVGPLFALKGFGRKAVDSTPLSDTEAAAVSAFWQQSTAELESARLANRFDLPGPGQIVEFWSRTANFDGVLLQESGRLEAAKKLFEVSRMVRPKNAAAEVNLRVNAALQARQPISGDVTKPLAGRIPLFILTGDGPVDEPQFRFAVGRALQASTEPFARTALIQLARAHQLAPENFSIAVAYAEACRNAGVPDRALATVRSVRTRGNLKPEESSQLLRLEANSLLSIGSYDAAESLLVESRKISPVDTAPLDLLSQLYYQTGRTNQALEMIDLWQGLRPNDLTVVLRRAVILMGLKQYTEALALLDRVVKQQPELESARAERGTCLLRLNRLDDARKDFEFLARKHPEQDNVQLTLGAIAERKNDVSSAITYYQRYLELASPDTSEYSQIRTRLERLKGGSRAP